MPVKTSLEIVRLAKPASYLGFLFRELQRLVLPGVTTAELNRFCELFLAERRMHPTHHGYRGFPAASCISVNAVAAHGLPGNYCLRTGDVVTVDVGAGYAGWKADAAWTYVVGTPGPDQRRLLRAAWRSCLAGIHACRPGRRVGDVGAAIQRAAAEFGCSVVAEFIGHGIGRTVHEAPAVPNVGRNGTGTPIVAGMVLNIEPVVALGGPDVMLLGDGWSYATRDGSPTAQYEHTVAVFAARTRVLTLPALDDEDHRIADFPPFY